MGCLSFSISSLALLISTQTRMSPSGFSTTTKGETHSVGPLGTSSMMSSLSNSSSCLLPSDRLCNRLNVFVHRQLNFQFTHSRKNISKVLNNVHRSSFTCDWVCLWWVRRSNSQHIQLLSCILSQQSFATTFNNSKLIHTLFSRLFTMNFTFKSSNNLDWCGWAISKQLLLILSGFALHSFLFKTLPRSTIHNVTCCPRVNKDIL